MPWLNWIEDSQLKEEVSRLLSIAKLAKTEAAIRFGKNVIDPFVALFEIYGFNMKYADWQISETTRQAQKTLQNHVGDFHQNILGYSMGWINKRKGEVIDLYSEEHEIIAEVKNKYNTISGGKLSDLYDALDSLVSPKNSIYKGYIAYYVGIIPKKPGRYNKPFTPSDKGLGQKCPLNQNIREIDGASFYTMVTGSETALQYLFEVLPEVIIDCTRESISSLDIHRLKDFFFRAYNY